MFICVHIRVNQCIMKISISYPPLESDKGRPTLSQNRQFQWFSSPTYIYPVVPASAATLLKQNGYEVFWDDGIAEELSYDQWLERIIKEKPDIVAIETKTPVIKRHWEIIEELKCRDAIHGVLGDAINRVSTNTDWRPIIVLMGDHVTALPEESFKHCPVDYVLTGGDYDFMLLNLANHLSKGEELEPGWHFRQDIRYKIQDTNKFQITNSKLQIFNTGQFILNHDLNFLPQIDRQLTRWQLYADKNGNYKYTPGAYIMASRDCWYGKCTFCSWANNLFPAECYRVRNVENVLGEIGSLIKLDVKEIMDDSGTFPIGGPVHSPINRGPAEAEGWLKNFCQGMIGRGYNKKIKISCNLRLNAIKNLEIYKLMKQAGFRMILFGLESANQKTLDKINKNLQVEEIESGLKMCKDVGLEPHVTVMLGYPWETREDLQNTLDFAKKLFRGGIVDSLQATIVIPYPGTPLYKYCQDNNLFKKDLFERDGVPRLPRCNIGVARDDFAAISGKIDYDRFDQSQQVMLTPHSDAEIKKMIRQFYRSFLTPKFFLNKIKQVRSLTDIKFYWRTFLRFLGHLADFSRKH